MRRLSIIVPFLDEADNLPAVRDRLEGLAAQLDGCSIEIVFVDDGSTDHSAEVIRNLKAPFPIKLVRLSRNFGSHAAIAAGVSAAAGDAMTFISADLQDPPEILLRMVEKWKDGCEIVWGMRESRKDPLLAKVVARGYYTLLRKFALPQMPKGGVDFCLVDSKVVESLGNLKEKNSNIFNLLMWSGFNQCFIPYHRQERHVGKSKWSLAKKLKLFIDSFVAFSFFPIRLISALGAGVSFLGLLYALYIIAQALMFGYPVQGWASMMVVVLLCSGLQLLMLGIVSEYLWRALDASRDRPLYIVRGVEDVVPSEPAPVYVSEADSGEAAVWRAR